MFWRQGASQNQSGMENKLGQPKLSTTGANIQEIQRFHRNIRFLVFLENSEDLTIGHCCHDTSWLTTVFGCASTPAFALLFPTSPTCLTLKNSEFAMFPPAPSLQIEKVRPT